MEETAACLPRITGRMVWVGTCGVARRLTMRFNSRTEVIRALAVTQLLLLAKVYALRANDFCTQEGSTPKPYNLARYARKRRAKCIWRQGWIRSLPGELSRWGWCSA